MTTCPKAGLMYYYEAMAGHSKWANIKHKKAAADKKRGATFTKLARLVEVAAKGGPDPDMNFRLKLAVSKAREANMPAANIDKAIRKGAGLDSDKSSIEEISYEGMGPGNESFIIESVTDNKNRTVAELRNIFTKAGGALGNSGSVAWQFSQKGILEVTKKPGDDQELALIDSGAEDFNDLGNTYLVHTEPKELNTVKQNLTNQGFEVIDAKLAMIPSTPTVVSDPSVARKVISLIETLEDHDDIDQVYTNFEIDDSISQEIENQ